MKAFFLPDRSLLETVNEGDTARETVIRLSPKNLDADIEPESAVLRIDLDPVVEITLTEDDAGDWYFRWTSDNFTDLPAAGTTYDCQVEVTYDDASTATFPTSGNLEIKVNDPI